MKDKIRKYWPEIVTVALAIWTQAGPAVTAFIQSHPHVSADIALVATFLARLSASPLVSASSSPFSSKQ